MHACARGSHVRDAFQGVVLFQTTQTSDSTMWWTATSAEGAPSVRGVVADLFPNVEVTACDTADSTLLRDDGALLSLDSCDVLSAICRTCTPVWST